MKLIFLHGPPAVGKLTVALELKRITGFQLFHNHLTVDLALSLFPFGSAPFVQLREEIWLSAFRIAARAETSLIFTFAPERTVTPEFIENTRRVVESIGGQVIFVELTCSQVAIESRLQEPSRADFDKLNSLQDYRRLKEAGAFEYPSISSDLSLDTTHTAPSQTAQRIAEYLVTLK